VIEPEPAPPEVGEENEALLSPHEMDAEKVFARATRAAASSWSAASRRASAMTGLVPKD